MSRFKRLIDKKRRGNYSILFALMVPVMFGFAAMGLDLSYIRLSQQQLQHVADSASHAAYVVYRGSNDETAARNAAEAIISRNPVGNGHADLKSVDFGEWTSGEFTPGGAQINAARVDLAREDDNALKLFFGPFMGVNERSIRTQSTTAGRTRQIMIVQDITGSFSVDIHQARAANLAFLDYLKEHPVPGDEIGMTLFIGGTPGTPWTPLQPVQDNYPSIYNQWSTLQICNCTSSCSRPFESENHAPHMPNCTAHGTNTSQGPGIDAAVQELLTNGDPTAFQAIIVISDGLPTKGVRNGVSESKADRERWAREAADDAWREGIHVWTVTFRNGGGDFNFLRTLARGQGKAYDTPNSSQLTDIMLEIAASIPVVLVE